MGVCFLGTLKNRGPGVAVLVLSWVITLFTLWQLVQMHEMKEVPGKRFDRYHELGQHAFGKKLGLWLVVPQQLIVEIGVDIVYMVTGKKESLSLSLSLAFIVNAHHLFALPSALNPKPLELCVRWELFDGGIRASVYRRTVIMSSHSKDSMDCHLRICAFLSCTMSKLQCDLPCVFLCCNHVPQVPYLNRVSFVFCIHNYDI